MVRPWEVPYSVRFKDRVPNVYIGGADHLVVEWLPKGTQFEIEEYDGWETLHVIGSRVYMEA